MPLENSGYLRMNKKETAGGRREYQVLDDDTGEGVCEVCGSRYLPLPGFINFGHQCDTDGTRPQYQIPPDRRENR